jgi:hypothetical protein
MNVVEAQKLADKAFESHKTAIDAIITEELGIDKEELGVRPGRRQSLPLFYFQLEPLYLYTLMF